MFAGKKGQNIEKETPETFYQLVLLIPELLLSEKEWQYYKVLKKKKRPIFFFRNMLQAWNVSWQIKLCQRDLEYFEGKCWFLFMKLFDSGCWVLRTSSQLDKTMRNYIKLLKHPYSSFFLGCNADKPENVGKYTIEPLSSLYCLHYWNICWL